MANVRKLTRADGTRFYQVRWRTPDGKHRTKGGFRTKKLAEDYATDIDHSQRRGTTFDPKSGQLPFRAAARWWLDSRHDLKPRTRAGYEYQIAEGSEIDRKFG
ncbi:Arm DNA-binding domain-containing protein, partial [Rhodococcus erythropolis]